MASRCTLTPESGGIKVTTPYDAGWVMEFKSSIPVSGRKPMKNGKQFYWIVAPQYGKTVQDLCMKYFNELPMMPQIANVQPKIAQKIIDVRYIGQTKDRGGDDRSAYGWYQSGWNVIFPESVLRGWFDAPSQPDEAQNLYSVLAVARNSTADEIKKGFWRMAKQWHPDTCKEPNAEEQFKAINHAYQLLSDPMKRERYDAGLALEASLKNSKTIDTSRFSNGYRSPLRCGLIMVKGIEQMGLFTVSKIFAWEDIKDSLGRTLVVSWKSGDDHFTEVWA
jgi:DnaJ-domain-containing protein 1